MNFLKRDAHFGLIALGVVVVIGIIAFVIFNNNEHKSVNYNIESFIEY